MTQTFEHGEFSVCHLFEDGSYEYVRRRVSAREAWVAFEHYTTNIASKLGFTYRVIITDGEDQINREWQYKKGIVFPLPEANQQDN